MKGYAIVVGLIAATIVILLLIVVIPPPDDFNFYNPYWNGLSRFSSELCPHHLDSIIDRRLLMESTKYILFIIGPEKRFEISEAHFLRLLIENGGIVVLMDDFGSGNSLLQLLEISSRLNGSILLDPLFKEKMAALPKIRMLFMNVSDVVLNYATVIDDCQRAIGYSSFYAFLDVNSNGIWDENEPKGPLTVACEVPIGRGKLIVISDSSIGINSMISMGSNVEFLKELIDDRECFVDKSHWKPSQFMIVKEGLNLLLLLFSWPEVRYAVIIGAGLALIKLKLGRSVSAGKSEVDKVLMQNPTWNREVLEKLWREMCGER